MTIKSFPGNVREGSSLGAGQLPTLIKRQPAKTKKVKYPSKAGRYGSVIIVTGKSQKRAT